VALDGAADGLDVLATISHVSRYAAVSLPPGPGRRMITSGAHATAAAGAPATCSASSSETMVRAGCTCSLLHRTASPCCLDTSGTGCPNPAVYEDLGAGNGYQPAFLIPN
jgi:hypothetical protein